MRLKLFTSLIIVLFCLSVISCRREQQTKAPDANTQPGQCPKIEGSFFGADKSTVRKGEAVNLMWKIPFAYAKTARIEGAPDGEPPKITSFTAQPTSEPVAEATPPEWNEGTWPNVKLVETATFTLKATGPEGCPPLELPSKVTVE